MTQTMLTDQDCKLFPAGICVLQYNWQYSGPAYYVAGKYKEPQKSMMQALTGVTPVCIWHIKPKEVANAS